MHLVDVDVLAVWLDEGGNEMLSCFNAAAVRVVSLQQKGQQDEVCDVADCCVEIITQCQPYYLSASTHACVILRVCLQSPKPCKQ